MGAKRTQRSGIAVRDQIKAAAAQATSRRFVGHAMAVSEWLAYESELRAVARATLLLALQRKRKAAHLRRAAWRVLSRRGRVRRPHLLQDFKHNTKRRAAHEDETTERRSRESALGCEAT
jgi:hypothetical protein